MRDETFQALQAWVLPWAKKAHPDYYEQTLKVAALPKSFKAYLLRLAELRWEEDPDGRLDAPILALEETSIVIKVRFRKTGEEVDFFGRRHKNRTRAIQELALKYEDWRMLENARREWDLEYI